MSSAPAKSQLGSSRLRSLLIRERVKVVLKGAGVVALGVGGILAVLPFGPSASNPVVIPKADPSAGLNLLQSLSARDVRVLGIAMMAAGGLALLISAFVGAPGSEDESGNAG
jgi:hypothetical protein